MSRFAISLAVAFYWILFGHSGAEFCRAEVILGPEQMGSPFVPYFRFSGGYPDNPATTTANPSFYLSSLDFSGVGWVQPGIFGAGSGTAYNVTMIDSTHFIGAYHVATGGSMSIGNTVNFLPAGSTTVAQRTIANLQQVAGTDVMLGTLNSPVPSGVAAYSIAASATPQQQLYVYGRSSEVGQNNVATGTFTIGTQTGPQTISSPGLADVGTGATLSFLFDYDQPNSNPDGQPSTVGNNEGALNAGDSGGPTFVMVNSQLQLLGANMFNISYDSFNIAPPNVFDPIEWSGASYLPFYNADIQALIAVPEPSSLALGMISVFGGVAGWVRSRRRPTTT